MGRISLPIALGLALWSCGDAATDGGVCEAGRVETCPCPGGAEGVQTCREDGTGWGLCDGCVGSDGSDTDTTTTPDVALDTAEPVADVPDASADVALPSPDVSEVGLDIVPSDSCDPCGYGSVRGVVCAPSEQVFVASATVTIATTDCDGTPRTWTVKSGADGNFWFPEIPCGLHTVHVKAGSFEKSYPVEVTTGKTSDHTGVGKKQCFKADSVPIAVFWGQWDHQHDLLGKLGLNYTYLNFEWDYWNDTDPDDIEALQVLRDPAKLAAYEILFFNCGSAALKWATGYPEIAENLREFVEDGGSLYASDLSWAYLEAAFPEAFDFFGDDDLPTIPGALDGPQQAASNVEIAATIVDPLMSAYVGVKDFTAKYGPGPLIAVTAPGPVGSVPHVMAGVKFEKSGAFGGYDIVSQPVVLSHEPGNGSGRVIYTTFHNEEQNDEVMSKLLYYLVFML
ncbi:MAG: carboxypeptidase regulatory-like domain-containing protein [Myxococcales bacterium]|nr:carboxypeptidase regulatory-like domain-containing protein [Myxococcales bacterium]